MFHSGSTDDVFSNIFIKGQFFNLPKYAGILFTGTAGNYNGVTVFVQAIVPFFGKNPDFVAIKVRTQRMALPLCCYAAARDTRRLLPVVLSCRKVQFH